MSRVPRPEDDQLLAARQFLDAEVALVEPDDTEVSAIGRFLDGRLVVESHPLRRGIPQMHTPAGDAFELLIRNCGCREKGEGYRDDQNSH